MSITSTDNELKINSAEDEMSIQNEWHLHIDPTIINFNCRVHVDWLQHVQSNMPLTFRVVNPTTYQFVICVADDFTGTKNIISLSPIVANYLGMTMETSNQVMVSNETVGTYLPVPAKTIELKPLNKTHETFENPLPLIERVLEHSHYVGQDYVIEVYDENNVSCQYQVVGLWDNEMNLLNIANIHRIDVDVIFQPGDYLKNQVQDVIDSFNDLKVSDKPLEFSKVTENTSLDHEVTENGSWCSQSKNIKAKSTWKAFCGVGYKM
jgi:hypothetical protein